jgi:hypothetical protein
VTTLTTPESLIHQSFALSVLWLLKLDNSDNRLGNLGKIHVRDQHNARENSQAIRKTDRHTGPNRLA